MGEPREQTQTRRQLESGLKRREKLWLFLALVIPGALFALWRLLYVYNSYLSTAKLDREAKVFDILLKVASISAIGIGAWWSYRTFFRQRLTAARLNLAHTVQPLELPDNRHLIKVYATIRNVGQVAVTLNCWRLSAEQLLPMNKTQERIARRAFTDKELPWPSVADGVFTIARDDHPEAFWMLLEPGEEDQASGNIIVPPGVDVVQIYSHFSLLLEEKSQGWEHKILVDLRQRDANHGDKHE